MNTVAIVRPADRHCNHNSSKSKTSVLPKNSGECELDVPGVREGGDSVGQGQLLLLPGD